MGLFALCWVGGPSLASAALKVAVVDVHKTMNATKHWKQTVKRLEKERKEKQAVLEAKQAELRSRKEKLDAKKAVSDPKATLPEQEELFRDAQLLTQAFLKTQNELAATEKRYTDMMLSRIERVVSELSLEADYTFVFEMGTEDAPNVLHSSKSVDITDKVIRLYKKRYKDKPLALK